MLTRSPVQPSPANASPRTPFHVFHYAPAASSSPSSSRLVSAGGGSSLQQHHRRQSSSSSPSLSGAAAAGSGMTASPSVSAASAPKPPPKRYVGVDASTQYSPMDSVAQPAAAGETRRSSTESKPEMPPTPEPKPMVLRDEQPAQPAKAVSSLSSTTKVAHGPIAVATSADASAPQPISPQKRRNSESQHEAGGSAENGAFESPSSLAKRPKPESAPPKVLPQRYEFCRVEDVVVLIANMLGELIETNDALALKSGHLTRFHSRTAPGISVLDYLHRLAKHATLSPPLLLSMVYYIDRLCVSYPDFTINTLTVHRFLITAATVAAKGLSDSFWNNSTYARVGGVRVAELKLLELEFLYRVDWKIVPNPEVLVAYYRGLVERCAGYVLEEESSGEEGSSEEIDDDEDVMTTSDEVVEEGNETHMSARASVDQ